MAKVYGIHEIEVFPGVDEGEMIKLTKEFQKAWAETGWNIKLVKGDRGQRAGKYAVLFEIPSVEMRDRMSPEHNTSSEEMQQIDMKNKEYLDDLGRRWAAISPTDLGGQLEYTDYIELV
jgi:hypothetical protein